MYQENQKEIAEVEKKENLTLFADMFSIDKSSCVITIEYLSKKHYLAFHGKSNVVQSFTDIFNQASKYFNVEMIASNRFASMRNQSKIISKLRKISLKGNRHIPVKLMQFEDLKDSHEVLESVDDVLKIKDQLMFSQGNYEIKEFYKSLGLESEENKVKNVSRKAMIYIVEHENIFLAKGSYFLKGEKIRSSTCGAKTLIKAFKKISSELINGKVLETDDITFCIPDCFVEDIKNYTSGKENIKIEALSLEDQSDVFIDSDDINDIIFDLAEKKREEEEKIERFSIRAENKRLKKLEKKELKDKKLKQETIYSKTLNGFSKAKSLHERIYAIINIDNNIATVDVFSYCYHRSLKLNLSYRSQNMFNFEKAKISEKRFFRELSGVMKHLNYARAKELCFIIDEKMKSEDIVSLKSIAHDVNMKNYPQGKFLISVKEKHSFSCSMYSEMMFAKKESEAERLMNKKEQLTAESFDDNILYVYSDASHSKKEKNYGYGIVMKKGKSDDIFYEFFGRGFSPYETSADTSEFNGILNALRKIKELKDDREIDMGMKVEIRCDCLNAVSFFNDDLNKDNIYTKSSLNNIYDFDIIKAKILLKQEGIYECVSFKWVKSHLGEKFNERADMLAKKGLNEAQEECII